jgi:hypothetical protein
MNLDSTIFQTIPLTKGDLVVFCSAINMTVSTAIQYRWSNRRSMRKKCANDEFVKSLIYLIINNQILNKNEIKSFKTGLINRYNIELNDLDTLDMALDKSYSTIFASMNYSNDEKVKFYDHLSIMRDLQNNDYTALNQKTSSKKGVIEILNNIGFSLLCFFIPGILYSGYLLYTTESLHLSDFLTIEFLDLYLSMFLIIVISNGLIAFLIFEFKKIRHFF